MDHLTPLANGLSSRKATLSLSTQDGCPAPTRTERVTACRALLGAHRSGGQKVTILIRTLASGFKGADRMPMPVGRCDHSGAHPLTRGTRGGTGGTGCGTRGTGGGTGGTGGGTRGTRGGTRGTEVYSPCQSVAVVACTLPHACPNSSRVGRRLAAVCTQQSVHLLCPMCGPQGARGGPPGTRGGPPGY